MDNNKENKRSLTSTSNKEGVHKLDGVVGFDALPEQVVNRAVQSGFSFNIICVGEPGIGKTTLLESLFAIKLNDLSSQTNKRMPTDGKRFSLKKQNFILTEGNVKLKLSLIETSGYGDQIDKRNCYQPIAEYIDAQFRRTLDNELKVCQRNRPIDGPPEDDTCVHVCLYFIEPTGHSLKTLDLVTLRYLDSKVNIVPVIAKSDTLSKSELLQMKKVVSQELSDIKLYKWPTDDENVAPVNTQMNSMMPFAIVGSSEFVKVGNKSVRGRQYPWGVVQVENEHHCDFIRLREMLLRTNMFDLIECTHKTHYELYRLNRLTSLGINRKEKTDCPVEMFENRRLTMKNEHEQKELELKENFIDKVKQKETELKAMEQDIHNELNSYKQWYRENRETLENKLNQLNKEIASFEAERKHNNRFTAVINRKLKR